jgi:hypothetical protein
LTQAGTAIVQATVLAAQIDNHPAAVVRAGDGGQWLAAAQPAAHEQRQ